MANFGAYAKSGNQWVSYNDISSVEEKAKFIKSNGYGGVALWTLDMDDFNNDCCYGANPILTTVGSLLRNVGDLPQENCDKPLPVSTPAPPESTTGFDDGGDAIQSWTDVKTTTTSTTTASSTTLSTTTTTKPKPKPKPKPGTDLNQGKKCNEEGKTFVHDDCSKYKRCVNGKIVILTCAVGLLWNNVRGQCDWPNQVLCGKRTGKLLLINDVLKVQHYFFAVPSGFETGDFAEDSTSPPMPPSSIADEMPDSCSPGEYMAAPGECGAYFSCSNGTPQKSFCSQGLHWVQATLSCNWAAQSNCTDDPDVQSIFYQEGQPCSGFESFQAHPEDCSSYLICLHNTFATVRCPEGLHWDANSAVCNNPEAANCKKSEQVMTKYEVAPTKKKIVCCKLY